MVPQLAVATAAEKGYGVVMPLIQRTELSSSLAAAAGDDGPKIFLFFGERFLCRRAADELISSLSTAKDGTVYTIDGDREDAPQTLSKLMSFSILPGLQIYRVNDSRLFHSKNLSENLWQKASQAAAADQPQRALRYLADMYHLASIDPQDRQPLSEMSEDQWRQLFGLTKPSDLAWTDEIFTRIQQSTAPAGTVDLADRYIQSFEKGIPANNRLILTAENVDKRKRLFTYIKKSGLIIDCSVAEGGGAAAQRSQKSVLQEMMESTLRDFGKTIDRGAVDLFCERVGFQPVAIVTETEKLALYCGDRDRITLDDLNAMVGRSREDALFELTDHFGKRQLGKTLTTLHHLLENGIHALAVLATLRNYIRRLLIFRSIQLQSSPPYQKGMNARTFQEKYLPGLKEHMEWKEHLGGHPYALFMSFERAAEHQCSTYKAWLAELVDAEFRLKGSGLAEHLILEELITSLHRGHSALPAELY